MKKASRDKCPICNTGLSFQIARKDKYSYYYCPNCTLTTSLPQPTEKEIAEFYDGFLFFKPKEEEFENRKKIILGDVKKIAKDIGKFKSGTGLSLLDVGGGLGFYSNAFSELGFNVTMVDLDKQACEYAKSNFKGRFEVVCADPSNFKFKKQFDVILCNEIIEHYRDISWFLDILKRNLKPDGLLIITTPNQKAKEFYFRPWWAKNYILMVTRSIPLIPIYILKFLGRPWICCDPPRHVHSFNEKSLRMLFEKKGFALKWVFTEYSTTQKYALKEYNNFKISDAKSILRIIRNTYAQIGIGLLRLVDRKNKWGNTLVVFATVK